MKRGQVAVFVGVFAARASHDLHLSTFVPAVIFTVVAGVITVATTRGAQK